MCTLLTRFSSKKGATVKNSLFLKVREVVSEYLDNGCPAPEIDTRINIDSLWRVMIVRDLCQVFGQEFPGYLFLEKFRDVPTIRTLCNWLEEKVPNSVAQ